MFFEYYKIAPFISILYDLNKEVYNDIFSGMHYTKGVNDYKP